MRAQTSTMLLLVLLLIFIGVITILLGLSNVIKNDDYSDLYTNNLLLSLMRTSTGYTDRCESMSDLLGCAFLTPSRRCGNSDKGCLELANETIRNYMQILNENINKNIDYYLTARSYGSEWTPIGDQGEIRLRFGDPLLETKKIPKRTASTIIQTTYEGNEYQIEVTLLVAYKH